MPSKSKAKGSGFEREVARYLTELYNTTFIRAPGSGAYTGGTNSHRKQFLHEGQIRSFKGDIIPGENFDLLNAEAKFYEDFGFHQLFEVSSQLEGWLNQLMTASDPGDLNVLFMKFNRKGRYVAVQASLPWVNECNYVRYTSREWGDWMIYSFEKFFTLNQELFKKYCEKNSDTKSNYPNNSVNNTLKTHLDNVAA